MDDFRRLAVEMKRLPSVADWRCLIYIAVGLGVLGSMIVLARELFLMFPVALGFGLLVLAIGLAPIGVLRSRQAAEQRAALLKSVADLDPMEIALEVNGWQEARALRYISWYKKDYDWKFALAIAGNWEEAAQERTRIAQFLKMRREDFIVICRLFEKDRTRAAWFVFPWHFMMLGLIVAMMQWQDQNGFSDTDWRMQVGSIVWFGLFLGPMILMAISSHKWLQKRTKEFEFSTEELGWLAAAGPLIGLANQRLRRAGGHDIEAKSRWEIAATRRAKMSEPRKPSVPN